MIGSLRRVGVVIAAALLAASPALAQPMSFNASRTLDNGRASSGPVEVSAANPLPIGAPQATATETRVTMDGTWVKVWTATTAKRVVIGLPSDSAAAGDYSFDATLAALTTSGGVPFASGTGGSFDFAGGAVPNTDVYVKATSGASLTVQVFN
jgi:hypothetical protein